LLNLFCKNICHLVDHIIFTVYQSLCKSFIVLANAAFICEPFKFLQITVDLYSIYHTVLVLFVYSALIWRLF